MFYKGSASGFFHPGSSLKKALNFRSRSLKNLNSNFSSVAYPDQRPLVFTTVSGSVMEKIQIRDPGSWSGMNITSHISKSLYQILWLIILKFFNAAPDPGSGNFLTLDSGSGSFLTLDPWWKNLDPGYVTLVFNKQFFLSSWKYDPGCLSLITKQVFLHHVTWIKGAKSSGSHISDQQHCIFYYQASCTMTDYQ